MARKVSDAPEEFFQDGPSDWARIKHAILQHYLRVFVYKLQRQSRLIVVVDGFAGAGQYADGSAGSPVIAVELNNDPGVINAGVTVNVVAIEHDVDNLASLEAALRPWMGERQRAWILPGEFRDHVEEIGARSVDLPTFVFLDPFGMKAVTVAELQPILAEGRSKPIELLIRVDPTLLARFAGQVRSAMENPTRQGTADAFGALLERMAIDPEWAAQMVDESIRRDDRRLLLLESFARAFQQRFAYVQFLPVRPAHGAAPKYFLMHATDSAHGYVKMNDVVSKLFETQEVEHHEAVRAQQSQADLFAVTPARRVGPSQLDAALLTEIRRSVHWREFIELRVSLVDQFGEDARERDHTAALRRLEQRKLIEVQRRPKQSLDRALVRPA